MHANLVLLLYIEFDVLFGWCFFNGSSDEITWVMYYWTAKIISLNSLLTTWKLEALRLNMLLLNAAMIILYVLRPCCMRERERVREILL